MGLSVRFNLNFFFFGSQKKKRRTGHRQRRVAARRTRATLRQCSTLIPLAHGLRQPGSGKRRREEGEALEQLRKKRRRRTQKRATLRVVTLLRSSAAGASFQKEKNPRDAFHPGLVHLHGRCLCPSSNLDTFDDLKCGCEPASSTSLPSGTSDDFPIGARRWTKIKELCKRTSVTRFGEI